MKKILSFFALAALLLTASCSKQESPVLGDDQVIISLGLEGVSATRAISDGKSVDKLVYEVYPYGAEQPLEKMDETVPVDEFPYSLRLPLAKGQDYTILFWAQDSDCQAYNTDNLKEVVVDYTNAAKNNDETRDAFYAAVNVHVTGGPQKVDVVLKRPFAQVNVAVPQAEWQRAIDAGVNVSQSSVVFTQEVAKKIDLSTGDVSEYASVQYTAEAIPTEKLTVNNEDYVYLSMSYILVGEQKSMVNNATFTFNSNVNAVTLSVPNLPVQRNYRTNVLGTFLVDYVDFNIVVDPIYNEDEHGVINGQVYTEVSTVEDFFGAVEDSNIDLIILNKDIDLNQISTKSTTGDPQVIIKKGRDLTIDLNNHKISATSSQTGKNYNMFDVRGTLTVKNGNMEYEHKGENMGWGASTNLFNVTAGGVLNLEGVTATNLGGSDMGFVVHLNNWGEVTLNVKDSYLESTYIAVRVFNSGNDMNNVTIYNSTLEGKYCFWVHNYTVADFGTEAKAAAHQALLNFDIFNGTNNFVYTGIAPVLFGFTDEIYFDANGAQYMFSAEELAAALKSDATEINVVLYNDIELPISSLGQQTGGSGEYKLGGENTQKINIDLNGKKLNITTTYWSVIGAKNDNALFTIKNGTMTSSQATGTWNSYDLTFANCNYDIQDVVFEKAIAFSNANKTASLENVTINETHDYYALWVSAKGQTLNIDGLTINSLGRGIKIDDQYVGEPAKVVMNISNAKFTTANKAAILVKSVAGAEINASDLDITNVAEDKVNAVWVDEDAAAYYDLVIVNGCDKFQEGAKKVSDQLGLNEAISAGSSNIVLSAGNYTLPSIVNDVRFYGSSDVEITINTPNMNGNNVIFDGVTVKGSGYATGVQHVNTVTYKNVTVIGEMCLYGENASFTNCTFELNKQYIWVYGCKVVSFDQCTFNTNGKAILVYNEGAGKNEVTVTNCTFNATEGAKAGEIANQNCAAIEINNNQSSGFGAAHKVTTSNNTVATNFSGEWRIKNYVNGNPINVNGVDYTSLAIYG
ncbi:MAG: hypothetical protein J6U51_02045, partial [Bacteroidales bacterium]|nr:hypothetical protein [Bacteroidales bacterium]